MPAWLSIQLLKEGYTDTDAQTFYFPKKLKLYFKYKYKKIFNCKYKHNFKFIFKYNFKYEYKYTTKGGKGKANS